MVSYERFVLDNGLRVLVHEDNTTPMAMVNILYDVGARDEDPERTGFAHLFEHLMFGGSINIPNYDMPLQMVGAENNAFTSNDLTNYYITLPAVNIETAFWLESDRMLSLAFSEKSLEVQKNVVVEEFKQRYLNQPYGDVWHKLRALAYQKHPYQWPAIGKELSHIEQIEMPYVKDFFKRYYHPENAILVVAGAVSVEQVRALSEKWFGPIPSQAKVPRNLPAEPVQVEGRRETVVADVPLNSIYLAFHGAARMDDDYYVMDLLSDVLSRGQSSRLYKTLVKEREMFSHVNAYITGSIDSSLLVVEGKPLPRVTMEAAEAAIWEELSALKNDFLEDYELTKVKNKLESTLLFGALSIADRAMNLAFFELLGDADLFNKEIQKYQEVSVSAVQAYAQKILVPENCSTLYYLAKEENVR